MVKNLTANTGDIGDTDSSLGWEDPLEGEMATLTSILAWRIPRTEEPSVHRVAKSRTRLKQLSKNAARY